MSIEHTISEIAKLPLEEQLQIIHAVWDRMPVAAVTQLTDEQRSELDSRFERYQDDPSSSLTESELREKIRRSKS